MSKNEPNRSTTNNWIREVLAKLGFSKPNETSRSHPQSHSCDNSTKAIAPVFPACEPNENGSASAWHRFILQLPIEVSVLGRRVWIAASKSGQLEVSVGDDIDDNAMRTAIHKWDSRKSLGQVVKDIGGGLVVPLGIARCMKSVTSAEVISRFVDFYLRQPIAPHIFMFNPHRGFHSYDARKRVVDQAYLTWFALAYYERRENGRLRDSIPCAGYRNPSVMRLANPNAIADCLCFANVLDASGYCQRHRNEDALTLFNFYPLFEREEFQG